MLHKNVCVACSMPHQGLPFGWWIVVSGQTVHQL